MDEVSRVFRSSFPEESSGFRTDAWRSGTARTADDLRPSHPTILHAFAAAARADATTGITLLPDEPAGDDDPGTPMSYRELYHRARAFAAAAAMSGIAAGDRVLLVLPTSFDFLVGFFGLGMAGAVPVPAYPPAVLERAGLALDRLAAIAERVGIRFCVTQHQLMPLVGELALRRPVRLLEFEELAGGDPEQAPRPRLGPMGPAFIQCTSGSTGNPKGVLLSHGALVANIHAMGQAARITRRDSLVSWLPLYHDMGLIAMSLFPIYWRIPLVLMSPLAFLSRPARWLWAVHRHRATMSAAPNFAYGLCVKRVRPPERQGLDLSSWRFTLNGAEPVNLRTVTDFVRAFAPHGFRPEAMWPVYGLAESCVAVACPQPPGMPIRHEVVDRARLAAGKAVAATGRGSMALVAVGRAIPGHQVRIVDRRGAALPEREVGHIVVAGPSLMAGYVNDAEATGAVLRGGWLWTGDLGYFSDGQLYVTGRAKDLIIVRGKNHYAEDLERAAERIEGVRPGGAVAFAVYDDDKATDLVVLVCETRLDGEAAQALATAVRERVSEHCAVGVDQVVLAPPGAIPRTSSGKRQRSACRELYLAGALGKTRTGKLQLAVIYVRARAGVMLSQARGLLSRQRPPA